MDVTLFDKIEKSRARALTVQLLCSINLSGRADHVSMRQLSMRQRSF